MRHLTGPNRPIIVEYPVELERLLTTLLAEPVIGVDTESCSMHRYRDRVCLLQISTADCDCVIDPLAVDCRPLEALFASPSVEKVMHAAQQDVAALQRDYGFVFANIFDTMLAARLLGYRYCGLSSLLERFFGVRLEKRFQRVDWSMRPLPEEYLLYAAADSHYLLPLRDELYRHLESAGRLPQARRLFAQACLAKARQRRFDPEGYRRLRGASELSGRQLAVLRELYAWREALAQRLDLAPFRVARAELLLRLALMQPLTLDALSLLLPHEDGLLRENATDLLEAIRRGLQSPPLEARRDC